MSILPESHNLIDELLAEQSRLTAVDRFARKHESGSIPAQARYYRQLLPVTPPGPGEQYAFGVDLDACTGCKACVSACHSLNGLDDEETWRDVGLLIGGAAEAPYQQTVTTACHHCVEPACAEGCPVLAYEKDEETGIVRHLDDQCIGCQYCQLKCPYEVPKYSKKRGIVRKCDMCYGRLAVGEAPACVQACPTGAITIRVVSKAQVRELSSPESQLVPGAFSSSYTKPSTSYSTRKSVPENTASANASQLRLSHAHWPLIGMLVLTQLAAGLYACITVLNLNARMLPMIPAGALGTAAFAALNLGLAVSVLHLGRPLGAWRAFLGLRRSWMSREIVAFTMFAGAAGALFTVPFAGLMAKYVPSLLPFLPWIQHPYTFAALTLAVTALAALSVFCSAMIYIDTRRAFWAAPITFVKFFGTALLLGASATAMILVWIGVLAPTSAMVSAAATFAWATTGIRTVLFGWEMITLRDAYTDVDSPSHFPALAMVRLLKPALVSRVALFVGATAMGLLAITTGGWLAAACGTGSFLLTLTSQIIERFCFFTAVDAPRMPGGVAQ